MVLTQFARRGGAAPTGDACGAVATQLAAKLKKADRINEKRFRVGKKLGEYELLAVCPARLCISKLTDADNVVRMHRPEMHDCAAVPRRSTSFAKGSSHWIATVKNLCPVIGMSTASPI